MEAQRSLIPTALLLLIVAAALAFAPRAHGKGRGGGGTSDFAGKTCAKGKANNDLLCMVCNTFFEARGEPQTGKVAVGRVVLTRTETKGYPDSVCGVIYQPYQFSWTIGGARRLPTSKGARKELQQAVAAAKKALKLGPNGSTHFHTAAVRPAWRKSCDVTMRGPWIGEHIFYDCTAALDIDSIAAGLAQVASNDPAFWPIPAATSGKFLPQDPRDFEDEE